MFNINAFVVALAFAAPILVRADVTPTEPAPAESFNEGSSCPITWEGDTNSTTIWKNMAIELMTGSNSQMIHLTTVTTGQDGTISGRFAYPCPQVLPNSAIYFYQFTNPITSDKAWTGRFTIAAADGSSTAPTNITQGIAWGVGHLANPSQATPPPSFDSSGSTLSSSVSSTANSSALAVTSGGTRAATASAPPVPTGILTSAVIGSSTIPTSSANSTSSAQSNGNSSGALGAITGFDIRVLGAAVAATLASSFVW